MGQEFNVVRCYSCSVFQTHQVRKDKKFVCKLCGEKQSVRKEYGRGSGKDCRVHVQKLNSLRRNLEEKREAVLEVQLEEEWEGQALEEEEWEGQALEEEEWGGQALEEEEWEGQALEEDYEGQLPLLKAEDEKAGSSVEGRPNGEPNQSVGGAGVSKWSKYLSSDSDSEEENNTRYTKATTTNRRRDF